MRSRDKTARMLLFDVPIARLTRAVGWGCRKTAYQRRDRPGTLTLEELAILAKENELDDEEIVTIVRAYQ